MKGGRRYPHRRTADRAATRALYERQRELRTEEIGAVERGGRIYVSHAVWQKLRSECLPADNVRQAGPLGLPLAGLPIEVVPWLPYRRKKPTAGEQRRAERAERRRLMQMQAIACFSPHSLVPFAPTP